MATQDGWRSLTGHLLLSGLLCVLPVYSLVYTVLAQPGQGTYFTLWTPQ